MLAAYTSKNSRAIGGFTLLELMIVLVILAIFVTIVAPSFSDTIQRNRRASALEGVLAMLTAGRAEAVSRVAPVALCPSTDQTSCNGVQWEQGYLMFVDDGAGTAASARNRNLDAGETVLRIGQSAGTGITVRSENFADAGGILFQNTGLAEQGTLVICDGRGASDASALILNLSGQARIATDANGDGIVENNSNIPGNVSCP